MVPNSFGAGVASKDQRKKRKEPQMNAKAPVLDALSNRIIGCAAAWMQFFLRPNFGTPPLETRRVVRGL